MTAGNAAQTAPWSLSLGRYELRYRLATGGMASVYLAKAKGHAAFEKWVAVKVISPQLATDKSFVKMFLDEARLVARLNHPNICAVLDFGEAESTYFLTMEYLHGESLSTLIKSALREDAPLPVTVACRIVADAARGLHAAHELKLPDGRFANVVHRDVSPQNIFVLYDGVTKVVDFGIARSVDRTAERTSTGMIKGKLSYMAPEQLRGIEPDRRIDVFALGVVLWECVTGKRLFQKSTEAATMCAVLQDPIPAASQIVASIAPELDAILTRALARNPDERFQTAGELAKELDRFIASRGVPVGPDEVGDVMRAHFQARIDQRDKLLNAPTDAGRSTKAESAAVADAFGSRETIQPGSPDASDGSGASIGEDADPESRSAVARKPQPTQTSYGGDGALAFGPQPTPSMPFQEVAAAPSSATSGRSNRLLIVSLAVALPLLGALVAVVAQRAASAPRTPYVIVNQGPTSSAPPPQPTPAVQPAVQPANPVVQPANATVAQQPTPPEPTAQPSTPTPTPTPAREPGRRRPSPATSGARNGATGAQASEPGATSGGRPSGVRAATNFDTL
ncbi:MAG: protein kinase [Myxococcales bacterium]|nr:protein kinase [Myxococcales bacterium]